MSHYTESKKNSNRKWDKENLDRISIACKKGTREKFRKAALAAGESVNRYIIRAVEERIQREEESND